MKRAILILAAIIFAGIVHAAPPSMVTGDFTSGFTIQIPIKEVYKVNAPYNFEIHVFNKTSGMPITSGIGCYFHLYNRTGDHIYQGFDNTASSDGLDYNFILSGSNFSQQGQYYYNVQCNNSIYGGFAGEYVYVTAQGVPYSTTHGIVYSAILFILIFIFIMLVFFSMTIDTNDSRIDNRVVRINYKKYLQIFLVCISYVTFIAINYFAWNISYGILEFTELAKFFMFLFKTSYALMYPIFIVVIIWSVAQYIKDRKVEEFIKRNLSFK